MKYVVTVRTMVDADEPERAARVALNAIESWWTEEAAAESVFWNVRPEISVIRSGDARALGFTMDEVRAS